MTQWVYKHGSAAQGDWDVSLGTVDSEPVEGWAYTGLKVADAAAGQVLHLDAADEERLVIPLSGAFDVTSANGEYHLRGRRDVFSGPTDVVYVGVGSPVDITSAEGGRVAVATAPATTKYPDQLVKAEDNEIVLRGNGPTSRQARNFGMMNNIQAERFLVCEVITPSGSWSSYPVHKHDVENEHETALEEIYYFDMKAIDGATAAAEPMAYQGASSADDRPLDIMTEVRPGDTVLIPYGWHGPSIAVPGYDLYYLNVMGGAGERDWRVTIREDQVWVNEALKDVPRDPRLPM
ncbi:5-deoxy-glucuronate isomerase [Bifidobacterium callitrichos]|uniref:5-deoxy-glucuronate isomerase n=1 Tax=Bifidobacterium callitrichos TaxID=762209 RepID=A0A5M9ZBF9_9BIFI|nr:5-deoxy-glucuronate isomerase [Bifidobacterium callitrichos]KAA8815798.1 5-deoxy-glucuronate isomerase [Bifidobacterium callitrichos]